MKKILKITLITALLSVTVGTSVFAVPVKVDDEREKVTATATVKPTQKTETKATASPTAKATTKPTESTKATETIKPTAKPTSTAKNEDDEKIVLNEEDDLVVDETQEPSLNIQTGSELLENKKYLTKGGAFWLFILTLILCAVISFGISYRFYMMAKRDNHIVAEIRALKRDIDNKMIGTIGGINEHDVSVINNNRGYAKENSSIHSSMPDSVDEADNEIFRKWETQINRARTTDASESNLEGRSFNERSVPTGHRRVVKRKKAGVSGKLKDFISDILPFDKK